MWFLLVSRAAANETYALSLHDALPICAARAWSRWARHPYCFDCEGRRKSSVAGPSGPGPMLGPGGDDDPNASGFHRCRSEEHTSELQSRRDLVCRLLLEKKKDQRHEPT